MQIWILSILIGALAGICIPLLWFLFQSIQEHLFSFFQILQNGALTFSVLKSFFFPAFIALLVFSLLAVFKKFRSADGFTYFISDLHFSDGRRKLSYSISHGVSSFLLLVGGGVVGIEAFAIEFLSSLGGFLGTKAQLPSKQVRTLTACGLTATLAALLGLPAAAFLFSIELLYGWGSGLATTVGPFALTAFVASSMSKTLTAPTSFFRSLTGTDGGLSLVIRGENFAVNGISAVFSVVIVGSVAAVFAAFVIWLFQKTDKELHALFSTRRAVDISVGAFGFRLFGWAILTGVVFYFFSAVLGTGATLVQMSLADNFLVKASVIVLVLRLLMGVLGYSVIGSIGLIMPTLVLGALLGTTLAHLLNPILHVSTATFALLSMGAFFSAAFGTPVAATALVYGYSGGVVSENIVFLFTAIAANFMAHYLCSFMQDDRMGSMGLYRHGIRFKNGMCFNTLSSIKVKDAMISWIHPVPFSSSIGDAYKLLMDSRFLKLPVTDEEGKILGIIALSDFYDLEAWRKLGESSQVHNLVGIAEIMKPALVEVEPEMSLEEALRVMSDEDLVPVVEKGKFLGILLKSDMVNLYNKEVVKKAFRR